MPILAIAGGRDLMFTAKMNDELANRFFQVKHLHLPSAGHLVMAELPQLVNPTIADWVTQLL